MWKLQAVHDLCRNSDVIAGMQEAFLRFATIAVALTSHAVAQHVCIPQHPTHSQRADTSTNLQQAVGTAGFQSQESALPQELLPPIYHMPFLCLLTTKANNAEHFASSSLCFSIEFSFGKSHNK